MMLDDAQEAYPSDRSNRLNALYGEKAASYFGNARNDIVALLKTDATSSILEVGCGSGGTGRAALAAGKAGNYVAIEVDPTAARAASSVLTEVVLGNVESTDLSRFEHRFDALIMSEVLEHLIDPWETLRRLTQCLRPDAAVFASSPNIAHWRALATIAKGRFDYVESGVFDRTHLRWFTPATFRELFEQAGLVVDDLRPLATLTKKARVMSKLSGGRLDHLFAVQLMVEAHVPGKSPQA